MKLLRTVVWLELLILPAGGVLAILVIPTFQQMMRSADREVPVEITVIIQLVHGAAYALPVVAGLLLLTALLRSPKSLPCGIHGEDAIERQSGVEMELGSPVHSRSATMIETSHQHEVPYLAALSAQSLARHDIEEIRAAIKERGYWEREDEWRISTFTTKRIEPAVATHGRHGFSVSVTCGHTMSCHTPTLERAVLFLGVYDGLVQDLYWSLGWPSWVSGTEMYFHSQHLAEIEADLQSGDNDRIRKAAARLGEFVQMDEAEAWGVWSWAQPLCRSDNAEVRLAVVTAIVGRLLRHHFKTFFPFVQELAMEHSGFADALNACWQLQQSDFPLNAKRRLALQRQLRAEHGDA